MELDEAIDRLYALPLGEFVPARNELAKTLRAGGDRQGAEEVKGLAKPSVTAWAVNQLWFRARPDFDRLLAAGKALRSATERGDGTKQAAIGDRRRALEALVEAAAGLLADAGHPPSQGARRRISHTLEAISSLDPRRLDAPPGRLTRDLEAPGFDALAALELGRAPRLKHPRARGGRPSTASQKAGPARPSAGAEADERRIQKAADAVTARQAELEEFERQASEAERALARAEGRAAASAAEAEEAKNRAREAAARAGEAEAAAKEARAAAGRCRAAVRRSAQQVETARQRLHRLEEQRGG